MTVWRYLTLSVVLTLLAACAAVPAARHAVTAQPQTGGMCQAYVQAWVIHFRARVSGTDVAVAESGLRQARAQLAAGEMAEDVCERPYCMVVPLTGGRLDSYCGYRRPDPSGRELYRWVAYR